MDDFNELKGAIELAINFENQVKRLQELSGIIKESNSNAKYFIIVDVVFEKDTELLIEVKRGEFPHARKEYRFDPENPAIPVKAHYHVYIKGQKKEEYAVNVDGTAHHRKNKGYELNQKDADYLRGLGVKISKNNLLEMVSISLTKTRYKKIRVKIIINSD